MLTVTERAKETLARLKATTDGRHDADAGLRLLFGAGAARFGLQVDRSKPGDQIVEYGGGTVLLIDADLADALCDATIDTEAVGSGDDLVITRPRGRGSENGST
jgi:Fe-S cluster assembly iron-binding protein IscA